ncbi:sulfotransferase [Prosthecodimorpha staleyi]|uniref:Sulfotransferase n=1 Tax=Prosthecodimorpha staleyi TaxID=2840188 RepID=A0A947GEB0_9HYPH|nr:sulfotransferase [Prosthecodimorpha staleyi]MBT9291722.1 sulfotransferase [Prosthecodimorpha staleyi]
MEIEDGAYRLTGEPWEPVAIGGIGGSGTRIVATLLQRLGRVIGDDLNESLDNLWFTLLFKRRGALLDTDRDFARLCDIFWDRMGGSGGDCPDARARLDALAAQDRMKHSSSWLRARVASWLQRPVTLGRPWGWKEPNTHIVVDRLFRMKPALRYIHIVRNPLDMALSSNQNQLEWWGPVLLDRPVIVGPKDALSYNCAVIRRIRKIAADHGERVCLIDYDRLCREPAESCETLAGFIGAQADADTLEWFSDAIRRRTPAEGRGREIDRSMLDAGDLEFVASLGYAIG